MSNIVEIKSIQINKRTTNRTNKYNNINNYFNLISKLNKQKEYIENDMKINDIENVLVKQYEVPYNMIAMLIDNINEKVAMEYEAQMVNNLWERKM